MNYPLPRLSFHEAMMRYGNDKPDIRFGMELVHLKGYGHDHTSGVDFGVFDSAERVVGIPFPVVQNTPASNSTSSPNGSKDHRSA